MKDTDKILEPFIRALETFFKDGNIDGLNKSLSKIMEDNDVKSKLI